MCFLSKRDSELCGAGEPEIFAPLPGTWFRTGYTQINLKKAGEHTLRSALAAAWREAGPERLAARPAREPRRRGCIRVTISSDRPQSSERP